MARPQVNQPLHVTVAVENPETLQGLLDYLGQAGIPTHGTRSIRGLAQVALGTAALVLFPDAFETAQVLSMMADLRRMRPRLIILIVTSDVGRFKAAVEPDGRSVPPLVLPKPAFRWTILDAIRAHVD